jgi:hypothetical protein
MDDGQRLTPAHRDRLKKIAVTQKDLDRIMREQHIADCLRAMPQTAREYIDPTPFCLQRTCAAG